MRTLSISALVLLALGAWSAPARAQDDVEPTPDADTPGAIEAEAIEPGAADDTDELVVESAPPVPVPRKTVGRLWLRFTSGFGGDYGVQPRSVTLDGSESVTDPYSEALEPSLGGHVQYEVCVFDSSRFGLALGFWAGAVTWITDGADRRDLGRSTWIDLDATIRLHIPLLDGLLDPYLLVPVGLTVNRFSRETQADADVSWGHGPGLNLGAMLGLAVDLGGHGVFVEGGWMHRQFFHESAGTAFGAPVTFELDGSTHQAHVGAGLFFDL